MEVREGTSSVLHFRNNMEIKIHLSVDEDKDLPFQREIGSALCIRDLETNKEDHRPTPDLH